MNTAIKRLVAGLVLSAAGIGGIVGHERMVLPTYLDPVGIPTVCAGHTATAKMGETKTLKQCEELLRQDVRVAESAIKRLVTVPVTQEQYDALVSFVFNVGSGNFAKSTLLKKINANDCWGAGAEFSRWNQAQGKVLRGLVIRRESERSQWETGCTRSNVTWDQVTSRWLAVFSP